MTCSCKSFKISWIALTFLIIIRGRIWVLTGNTLRLWNTSFTRKRAFLAFSGWYHFKRSYYTLASIFRILIQFQTGLANSFWNTRFARSYTLYTIPIIVIIPIETTTIHFCIKICLSTTFLFKNKIINLTIIVIIIILNKNIQIYIMIFTLTIVDTCLFIISVSTTTGWRLSVLTVAGNTNGSCMTF